nr:nuclear transport factor 2 family protein [Pseudomonas sp. TH31]
MSQTLLLFEQRLLSQTTRRDAEEISRLLADDFIEFGANGSIWTKAEVVEQLPLQPFAQRTISEFAAKQLSEDTALVTYHCHTVAIGQRSPANSLRSSIWRQQGEHWQMVFHQGTFLPQR